MDKNVLPKFNCFLNPSTIGPQWTRWLTSFKLNANEKGLILDAAKAQSNATSPGWAGCAGEIYHLNWNRGMLQIMRYCFQSSQCLFCATAKLGIRPPDLLLDHAKPRWNCSTVHHLLKEISLRLWFWHCHTDNRVRDAHLNKWLSLTSNENCLKKAKDWSNNTYPTDCLTVRKDRNPTGCTFTRRRRIRKYPLSEVTIRALAHKGDSKGEIWYVIDLVWLDI